MMMKERDLWFRLLLFKAYSNQGRVANCTDVEVNAPSLHHVFLHLTGDQLRDLPSQ